VETSLCSAERIGFPTEVAQFLYIFHFYCNPVPFLEKRQFRGRPKNIAMPPVGNPTTDNAHIFKCAGMALKLDLKKFAQIKHFWQIPDV
jgi:hypothetical protein